MILDRKMVNFQLGFLDSQAFSQILVDVKPAFLIWDEMF